MQRAIARSSGSPPKCLVITDVCLCEYTDHGHCGVVNDRTGRADVDNDATLELLARQAVSHARAGADMVAPSGMMDGMVAGDSRRARRRPDCQHVPIMSYAAKYASAFYGPFREAAESAPANSATAVDIKWIPAAGAGPGPARSGARSGRRGRHADGQAGAGLSGIVRDAARRAFPGVPLAAYNVSGEYSMIKAAAARRLARRACRPPWRSLLAIRRAGAGILLTYWAKDVAGWRVADKPASRCPLADFEC